MVNRSFKIWVEVIVLTIFIGVLIQDVVPAPILYFSVCFGGLVFVIRQCKNWDYHKGGM
jgi:hypothetical protein